MPTPPHSGAPKGNTNALKHGFYSRAFRTAEQTGLDDFDPTSLQNEIELMRVFMLRTAELGEQAATLAESMTLLNVLSRAALSLGALIRTHQALTLRKESADLTDLNAQLNAANRRATALLKLLPPQPPDPPVEVPPTARRASCIPSTFGRGQGEGSSLPPTPPAAGCEADQNLHREDAKDAKKAETGQGNAALDTQSALSSSRSSRLRGASSFDPPTPAPTYTLGPEYCFPSPKCFTCPERPLCPDCQIYIRTHTPPSKNFPDVPPPVEGNLPVDSDCIHRCTLAAEILADPKIPPSSPEIDPLPSPLSLFYTLSKPASQPSNCSELFPPNNPPSPAPPQTTV